MIFRLVRRKGFRTAWLILHQDATARLSSGEQVHFSDKIVLFLAAMLQWRRDGFRRTPASIAYRRISICTKHPECWKKRSGIRYCSRCGCTALKQHLPASRCPRGFW